MQLVGRAINKVKLTNTKKHITAIGLCKWGSVKDVENLTQPQQMKKQVIFALINVLSVGFVFFDF